MSLCRWSTDDFQCDLYCYESVGDVWVTHVASNRLFFKEQLPRQSRGNLKTPKGRDAWLKRHQQVMRMVDEADRRPIGLPYDGETFSDSTIGSFLDTLLMLRRTGYIFPYSVVRYARDLIKEHGRDATMPQIFTDLAGEDEHG